MNLTLDKDLSIEVVRTNRKKTASIKIVDGSVQVIVPQNLSDARVEELIQKRTPWIRQKLRQQSETVIPKPKEYVSGENFTYLGRNYRLKLVSGGLSEVRLKGGYLELGVSKGTKEKDIRNALVRWYEEHALERLTEKTARYAKIMGVSPNSIIAKDYKSRWGSCSSKGGISYNWGICHLKHPNGIRRHICRSQSKRVDS